MNQKRLTTTIWMRWLDKCSIHGMRMRYAESLVDIVQHIYLKFQNLLRKFFFLLCFRKFISHWPPKRTKLIVVSWTDRWPLLVHCEKISCWYTYIALAQQHNFQFHFICAGSVANQFDVDLCAIRSFKDCFILFIFTLAIDFIFKPFNLSNLYVGWKLVERQLYGATQLINNYQYYMRHSITPSLHHSYTFIRIRSIRCDDSAK